MVTALLPVRVKQAVVRRRGKTLLGPVDLELGPRGFTIVLGPNGAGKTTLLKTIHGLSRLSSGHVKWSLPAAEARQRQGYVFQSPIMLRRSVRANLAYPLRLAGARQKDIAEAVEHWAGAIGLSGALDRPAPQLSGGEKQKLALARALIRSPDILFLDEPCANLDGRSMREIETLLQKAHDAGTRIVMSTHDLAQAQRLATDILFLFNGTVHESGPAEQCLRSPRTAELAAFLRGDILE
ncbi:MULTISPECIES: ATP-binding cassette domain-containing protein [unclassified Sulfitobacter]|uniref:ATP-binding cassette domain-containing protein n=1 Tax=unclassified Sulfitobacter TaxID=196795 RepID=UPI0007C34D61|nr:MULTISPECIES: ATP-binding cassette domain-containing protein [unclassified Sulfitobacter]KZY06532.1 sulfate ABC transporter ATP-binding protein [Sulfitobacter sp. HI0023]KZY27495.1 sulfate ABC transporter ATP-binding protein [Sulfitobacter sp. HI0040]KZZ62663.1 sulfate ABC transporter ATP-binding protein [Sulfitobacter sp. HI0129]